MSTTEARKEARANKAFRKAERRAAKAATPKPQTHTASGAEQRPPKWLRNASRAERDAYAGQLAPMPRSGYGYLTDEEFKGSRWWNHRPAGQWPRN